MARSSGWLRRWVSAALAAVLITLSAGGLLYGTDAAPDAAPGPGADAQAGAGAGVVDLPTRTPAQQLQDRLWDGIQNADPEIVAAALIAGADPNLEYGRLRPLTRAMQKWATPSSSHRAEEPHHEAILTALLEHGADPNRVEDMSPLLWQFGRSKRMLPLFKLALEHGADPNVMDGGVPVFYNLTFFRRVDALELLAAHGANFNIPFEDPTAYGASKGGTAVHYLALHGYDGNDGDDHPLSGAMGPLECMLKHGGDPNRRDALQQSPLHVAVLRQNPGAVRLLIENGADPGLRDANGFPPISYASDPESARLLMKPAYALQTGDLAEAISLQHPFAVLAIYPRVTGGLTPVWLALWAMLLGMAAFVIRRRQMRLQPTPTASRGRRKRAAGEPLEKTEPAAPETEWSGTILRRTNGRDRKRARMERVQAAFERLQPYVLIPLIAWGLTWALFFVDPYLRALGLVNNLETLGMGLVLAATAIPLLTGSDRARLVLCWVGLLVTIAAMAWSLYWVKQFWQLAEIWLAILFTLNTAVLGVLGGLFWHAFSTAWVLRKLRGKQKRVKLTAADELETPAGWDQA